MFTHTHTEEATLPNYPINPAITLNQLATVADMIANGRVIYAMTTHPYSGALTVKGPIDGLSSGHVETLAIVTPDGRQTYTNSEAS